MEVILVFYYRMELKSSLCLVDGKRKGGDTRRKSPLISRSSRITTGVSVANLILMLLAVDMETL